MRVERSWLRELVWAGFAGLLLVVGCGGSDDASVESPQIEASPKRALTVESLEGCRIDADCPEGRFCFQQVCTYQCKSDDECQGKSICDWRGRCGPNSTSSEGMATSMQMMKPKLRQALPNLEVTEKPDTEVEIGPSQEDVTFRFKLNKASPPEGIAYRVRRSDGRTDPGRLRHTAPGESFEVTLDAGKASPKAEQAGPVTATISSAIGTFDVLMRPEPSWEGLWQGQVELETLGGQGLPLQIWVAGQDRDTLKLALPVGPEQLFSPRDDFDDERAFEVAELKWRDSLDVYQAVFEYEYRFESGVFADLPEQQVKRTIRFDIEPKVLERGRLAGRVMDSWSGLYEVQSKSGIRQVGDLVQYGDFELERTDPLPVEAEAMTVRTSTRQPDPSLLDAPEPSICGAAAFEVEPVKEKNDDGEEMVKWTCEGIETAGQFHGADVDQRVSCAMAVASSVRTGETTSEQLDAYFDDKSSTDTPFEDFLKACADENDDACQPLEGAECATALLGHTARDLRDEFVEDSEQLKGMQETVMVEMEAMVSEAFLAKQLGAFYVDLETRRMWLESATAPGEFLSAVEKNTRRMMEDWKEKVLDTQTGLLEKFFTRNSLIAMGRNVDGEAPNTARNKILSQGGMLWRAAIGSMAEAARRWDRLVKDEMSRTKAHQQLGQRAVEMYVLMGLLHKFNRSEGSPGRSALLVGDFADMLEALDRLGTPFEDALYARDAEVVTATSLDPTQDNDSLLTQRREVALSEVESARTQVESLLEELKAEALSEAELRGKLERRRRESANKIAELCGLPPGCEPDDLISQPEKCLRVENGWCGLNAPGNEEIEATFDPSKVAASRGGSSILDILEAYQNLDIAKDDLAGHLKQLQLELAELRAFKNDIDHWNRIRSEGIQNLKENLAARRDIRDQRLATLVQNLEKRSQARLDTINLMKERFAKWNRIRVEGAEKKFSSLMKEFGLRSAGDSAEFVAEAVAIELKAAAESLPKVAGTSTDPSAPMRGRLKAAARWVKHGGKAASLALNKSADHVSAERERAGALREAKLARLEEQAEVTDEIGDHDIKKLEEAMRKADQIADDQLAALEEAVELARAQREAELAYKRDFAEFRQRRTEYKKSMIDGSGLRLKVRRAQFNILQKGAEYRRIVQKARLEKQRFLEMNAQLGNLNHLLGGKSVVFLRFQKLRRAEDTLDSARRALMDWLVVLEYYAVRPFMAQRIKILLARNAYELEAIAEELKDLERSCGGSERSEASVELSVRKDLMAMTQPQADGDRKVLSPAERFRGVLSEGYVPVDRRIRYRTSTSLDDVLYRENGLLAMTFSLRLDKFANLPLACNAKLKDFSIQLVGEDMGEGQPSVSLIYDGAAQLRSCQPDIEEYVSTYAPGLTSYGEVSYLRTAGRSASPVAAVNEFPSEDDGTNRTLAGLPLASQYTLLIDTTLPNNQDLDWSKLEDVKVRLHYTYQDLFPEKCG